MASRTKHCVPTQYFLHTFHDTGGARTIIENRGRRSYTDLS